MAEFLGGTRLKTQGGFGKKKVATTIDAKSISEFITKFSELYVLRILNAVCRDHSFLHYRYKLVAGNSRIKDSEI